MKEKSFNEELIQRNLQKIAKKEGISEDKVKEEILYAISLAMKSDDPAVQTFWKKIPCEGDSPTVEETINYIISTLPPH
ncbi:MAG: hypothetical protein PHX08_05945 [Lachnospiraceae bacterium]|nr:hypothetical protein [Lachnospiraceae bacterium]